MSYQADNAAFNNAMDSLKHYGTKGMKWGNWNDDTKRKYGLLDSASVGFTRGQDGKDEEELAKAREEYVEAMTRKDPFVSSAADLIESKYYTRLNDIDEIKRDMRMILFGSPIAGDKKRKNIVDKTTSNISTKRRVEKADKKYQQSKKDLEAIINYMDKRYPPKSFSR